MSWTDERIELLRRLWEQGLSASQIAGQIGGVTRNAVIGKVHRLGLAGRAKSMQAAAPRQRKAAGGGAVTVRQAIVRGSNVAMRHAEPPVEMEEPPRREVEAVVVPMSERVTIVELREAMCRWPLGDPLSAEFRYCGNRCTPGASYCAYHARLAYQPAADRRRDRGLAARV